MARGEKKAVISTGSTGEMQLPCSKTRRKLLLSFFSFTGTWPADFAPLGLLLYSSAEALHRGSLTARSCKQPPVQVSQCRNWCCGQLTRPSPCCSTRCSHGHPTHGDQQVTWLSPLPSLSSMVFPGQWGKTRIKPKLNLKKEKMIPNLPEGSAPSQELPRELRETPERCQHQAQHHTMV